MHKLPVLDTRPAEAAELVEIQLGHMCNNRCVFCSSGQATQMGQALPMELAPVLGALERAKRQRARKVTFLGGEPTLQRAFLPALRRATDLGFEEIEIFTNGVKAARRSFVDEVAAIGRFSWRFSIQGGNRDAHDEAVVKPGAFLRICRAMDNVREHGHRITANACINELSYRSLPDYVGLVQRHG
ncbi:MAG: radical SAM protein, partial [Nannocystaceae bacterium]|nr:radical SAM protein [Nannocystaceae bacterium]